MILRYSSSRIFIALICSVYALPGFAQTPAASAAGVDYGAAMVLQTNGCNSTAFSQIPGTPNLFLARNYFDDRGNLYSGDCNAAIDKDHHHGLVLEQLDWTNKKFTIIKPVLPVPLTVSAGPLQGATIKAAYDPSVVRYHGQYWVSFECGIPNGARFNVQGTSSCMAPFDLAKQEIDPAKVYVVVSGHRTPDKILFSASVPTLSVLNDKLYLYWSVLKANVDHQSPDFMKFYGVAVHGAELVPDNKGYWWVKNAGKMAYSDGQNGVEVWGPDSTDPTKDSAVGIRMVWPHGSDIIALAGIGGGGCARPGTNTPGCFRMALAKASQPLGYHIFNTPLLDEAILPTNPQDYTRPVKDPQAHYYFLGNFYYPFPNGLSEQRLMPPRQDWPVGVTPIKHLVTAFPFTDSTLWPDQ